MPAFPLVSDAGRLRAIHDPPERDPPESGPVGAVVCHPHPLHGGTMDNKVVFTVARRLREHGLHVLRFNFRGHGGSEGTHDEGRGERGDVAAAIDALAGLVAPRDARRLSVCGYSFGSFVGLSEGVLDERVMALLAIAPPVNHYDFSPIATTSKPVGVVYAPDDELVPVAAVRTWLDGFAREPVTWEVGGGGHLFHARLDGIRAAVDAWLEPLQREGRDRRE